MRKIAIVLILSIAGLKGQSLGFIFHDPGTCAELMAFKSAEYGQLAQELGYSAEQIAKLQQQIQKFQEYKAQFDRYYGTFAWCYRAIDSGNWQGLATTINQLYLDELARRQDEIDEAQAAQVRQEAQDFGLVSMTEQMNQESIDQMVAAMQDTDYYRQNPEMRKAVDEYTQVWRANYQYNNALLNKVTAIVKTIQAHNVTIARLEEQNKQLSTGDDQQSLVAQLALNNQLLLESLKLQAEIATLNSLLAGRQVDGEMIYQRSSYTEVAGQTTRAGVLDQILAPLSNETPASPKRKR